MSKVKIKTERGRGKFKPISNLSTEEVRTILLDKISEEKGNIIYNDNDENLLNNIKVRKDKFNLVGLFSGCGGLDLGFELAGLCVALDNEKAMEAFRSKELYEKERVKSIFHTIYTNDVFKEANETYKYNFPNHIVQHEKDIRKISHFPRCNIMLGGFPCPGFSEAGPRLVDDERNFYIYILYVPYYKANQSFL